ncbi:MAG: PD-(D/E)XK nuclease family protein [Candidatus Nitrotoga sp.]
MRPINRTLTMLVFDRIEMSVIEMANPRGHRDVPTLHSYMTVSCAVRKFEEDQKNVVTLELTPRFPLTPRFRAQQYRGACNEMSYVNARGELRRIDRLVEFDDEVWVLDYKTGAPSDFMSHSAQMQEYRVAMQAVYVGKIVRCALLYSDGTLCEISIPTTKL